MMIVVMILYRYCFVVFLSYRENLIHLGLRIMVGKIVSIILRSIK